jgi:multiple antibiotic resistance protein
MLAILLIDYSVLVAADKVQRMLGETGINVMSRVMGLVLAALAVESVLTGIRQSFPHA